MNKCTGYSKMWFLVVLLVAFVAGCASNANEIIDTTRPTVSFTAPANGDVAVPYDRKISVAFSETMNPLTITAATFTLTGPGLTPVTGTVAYIGTTATFTPATNLANSTLYTGTITTGAKDLAGNALATNYVWTFTTGAAPDSTRPTVSFTAPVNGQTAVPINRIINVAFSEALDPLTITTTTFTVTGPGLTPVTGSVAYTGTTATYTPTSNLANSTMYTATITTGVKDLAGNALATSSAWTFTTGAATDTTRPTVSVISPTNGAVAVPINRKVTVGFSEAIDPLTITTATFTVTGPGATPVTGTVTAVGTSATFTPISSLANSTIYTVTITGAVKDLASNNMAGAYVSSFTTSAISDVTKPTVSATTIANGAINVPTNSKIGATFSEVMDPLTITSATVTLKQGATDVSGTVTYSGVNAVFTPASTLAANTTYTATITTGAKDLAGNALASNYVWSFTTAATADIAAPTVILVNPANLATNVALNSAVHATFSEAMDPLTISTASFSVAGVSGLVTFDAITKIATFTPASNLAASTLYTATVTTGATDLAGNPLAVNKVWSFTTAPASAGLAPVAVALGLSAPFGTFGGTAGMTNTGTLTIINGDVGTTATGTGSITGFHDTAGDIYTETPANIGPVNGKIYTCTNSTTGPTSASPNAAACATATQARLDAQTAYLALVAMPPVGASPAPGANLAGLTLLPGVYTAPGGSFMIQGGNLTLDAQGDANAVWVFQMAGTLTVGGPGAAFPQSIILAGGAQPKNIFWQVGTFATINAAGGGTMVGTIISQSGASFSTVGNVTIVTLLGRVLSLGASVTLVDTVIDVPAP